jgi:hypothetical protein
MLMTSNKIQDLLITFFEPDSLQCIQLTDEHFLKVFFHLFAIVQIKSKPGSQIQATLTFIHSFFFLILPPSAFLLNFYFHNISKGNRLYWHRKEMSFLSNNTIVFKKHRIKIKSRSFSIFRCNSNTRLVCNQY